jgi:pimeloyl-ACP methyl ester carboxylesterase/ketosteroid isomerase-like protein
MQKSLILLLAALSIAAAPVPNAVDEVRKAETAFAKAFADRDRTAFFAFVADDATFLSALGALRGKQAVVERWSPFFEGPEAPFSWTPERVEVSADGTVGLSIGPVYDAKGKQTANYISTWRKGPDGQWKVVFDGGGGGPANLPETIVPFEEGFVKTADGLKLYYRKIGRGPVKMIVPLDAYLFDQMKQFADVATVVTYDLRNRGRSEGSKDATIFDDVRDLEAVREQMKFDKFVPVGFSYLGKMVVMYAAEHPDRVSRAVQIGPLANKRIEMPIATDFGAPEAVIDAWRASQAPEAPQKEACIAQGNLMAYYMVGNPKNAAKMDSAAICAYENEWPVKLNAHFASLMKGGGELTADQIAKITMPVLTIHGTKDRQAAYEGGVKWAKELPDARLVTVEGAAHASWLDNPALVFGSIRHFLRGEWPLTAQKP